MRVSPTAPSSPSPSPLRVLLAVDYGIVREALVAFIQTQSDMLVVAQTDSERVAIQQAVELRPDVVVMDWFKPMLSLVAAVRTFKHKAPEAKLLVLLQRETLPPLRPVASFVSELSDHADGYFFKDSKGASTSPFLFAVRAVADGRGYQAPFPSDPLSDSSSALSLRESEILRGIAWGFSRKEIAAHLGLSIKTVETYKTRAMQKAGLQSRVDIVCYAVQHEWLGVVKSGGS